MVKYQQILHAKALLTHQSFRQAAKAEYISQPAFSRSIANLEDSLGVVLFNRQRGNITPTKYGDILEKHISLILNSTSELEREIGIHRDLLVGEINVAMAPFAAEMSGNKAFGSLISKHPQIRCRVTSSDWDDVEKLVLERKADVGFAELYEAEKNKKISTELIGHYQVVFFCRHGHPLLQNKQLGKEDLDEYPLALIKLPGRVASVFPGILYPEEHSSSMLPSIRVNDLALARQVVLESDAFSVSTPYQIRKELKENVVCILPFHEPWMALNYGFMYEKDRLLSPIAIKYMELVRVTESQVRKENSALLKEYLPDRLQ